MSYSTVKDIMDYSRSLHEHARNLYEQLRDQTQKERVDMMLTLLAEHEDTLATSLKDIQDTLSEKVLKEWHQFEPGSISDALAGCGECHPDMDVDELAAIALKIDDYMIGLYKQMLSESTSSDARRLFGNLVKLEESEKMRTVRAALSANDW